MLRRALLCLSLLTAAASAETAVNEWTLDDRIRVKLPASIEYGVPFEAEIELLEVPEEPQRLELRFNHLKKNGKYGRGLQPVRQRHEVSEAGVQHLTLQLDKQKPDLGLALLTLYLSPDGKWQSRTLQANFPLKTPDAVQKLYEQNLEKAGKQSTMPKKKADSRIPVYEPREEYFTQREDEIGIRSWKPDPQRTPPLADILARPGRDRAVFGVYCWANEYERTAEEVAQMGFRTMRLSGPWAQADEALVLAAQNGVEVLFSVMGGADKEAFYKTRRQNMPSDEAMIEAFASNVTAFVEKFGPNGTFFADRPEESPVRVVELWNEPNFHYLIPDSGDRSVDEPKREALYAKMIVAGYDAAKAADPDILVAAFAAGGSGAGDVRFIEHVLRENPGIEQKFDILTTHPYVMGAPPETQKYRSWGSYSQAHQMEQIRASLAKSGVPDKPIWYTELGWQFAREHGGLHGNPPGRISFLVTPDLHAAYVMRSYLWAMRLGVDRVHIMHLYDSDGFNGGFLLRRKKTWRPVAHAAANITSLMPNPKMTGAQIDGADNSYIYAYVADHENPSSGKVIVAWNVMGPTEVEVSVEAESVRLLDLVGNEKTVAAENGKVALTIGPYPQYLVY